MRKITNLFRKRGLKITFTTHNSILNKLNTQPNHTDQYTKSGLNKLTCKTCQKSYIGHSGRKLQ
jgi:hypothetical protein